MITAPSPWENFWLQRTLIICALVSKGLCINGKQGTGATTKDRYQIQTYGNCCSVHLIIATPTYNGSGYRRMLMYRETKGQTSWRKLAVSSQHRTLLHQYRTQNQQQMTPPHTARMFPPFPSTSGWRPCALPVSPHCRAPFHTHCMCSLNAAPHFSFTTSSGTMVSTCDKNNNPHSFYKYLGVYIFVKDDPELLFQILRSEIRTFFSNLQPLPLMLHEFVLLYNIQLLPTLCYRMLMHSLPPRK